MATGGKRLNPSDCGGSEEYFEFVCSPCSDDENHTEAIAFCIECSDYMCQKCLEAHNRRKKMKDHKILNQAAMKAQGHQPVLSLPTKKCTKHHGRILDTYCGEHDEVCCVTCISIDHRTCTGVDYLPDVAKDVCKSKTFQEVKDAMKSILTELKQLKHTRKGDLCRLQKERQDAIDIITTTKQKIIKHLDKLEQEALQELHDRLDEIKEKIESDMEQLKEIIDMTQQSYNKLDISKVTNESEIFVNMKMGKKEMDSTEKIMEATDLSFHDESLAYITNQSLNDLIENVTSFGEIRDCYQYKVVSHDQYNVHTKEDKEMCDITGICQLEDGTILITDWRNKTLKKLDISYQVAEALEFPCELNGVCCTGEQKVAVTLPPLKQVQFVSVGSKMKATKKFSVGDYCRGIDCHGDKIYVTCGGGSREGEGPGQVMIYNKAGELISRVERSTDNIQIFTVPIHIAVSKYNSRIYVTDRDNGVVILDRQARHVSTITDPKLKYVTGVCLGDQRQCMVAGWSSNNVVLFGKDNTTPTVLLQDEDAIKMPECLFYDKAKSKLIVGMQGNNVITVSKLVKC